MRLAAGTKAQLGDLTRYLTYHEHHGYRLDARENYRNLTESERDWSNADLVAAAPPAQVNSISRSSYPRLTVTWPDHGTS